MSSETVDGEEPVYVAGPVMETVDSGEANFPPSNVDQQLLDFMKGAKLGIEEIEQLWIETGSAAGQIERQAATIRALQARLRMVLDALRLEQKGRTSDSEDTPSGGA